MQSWIQTVWPVKRSQLVDQCLTTLNFFVNINDENRDHDLNLWYVVNETWLLVILTCTVLLKLPYSEKKCLLIHVNS